MNTYAEIEDVVHGILEKTVLPFGIKWGWDSKFDGQYLCFKMEQDFDPASNGKGKPTIVTSSITPSFLADCLRLDLGSYVIRWIRNELIKFACHEVDERITIPGGERPFDPHRVTRVAKDATLPEFLYDHYRIMPTTCEALARFKDELEVVLALTRLPFGIEVSLRKDGARFSMAVDYDAANRSDMTDIGMSILMHNPFPLSPLNAHVWLRTCLHDLVTHEIDERLTLPDGTRPFDPHGPWEGFGDPLTIDDLRMVSGSPSVGTIRE